MNNDTITSFDQETTFLNLRNQSSNDSRKLSSI